jgi:hypothetical protein
MQAYALKKSVEALGHEVTFCDFLPGLPRHRGQKIRQHGIVAKIARITRFISSPKKAMERRAFGRKVRECIRLHAWPALGVSEQLNLDYSGDAMLIGSDEVFNYTQNHALGYVPALFGHGISARLIVAYAASAGYTNVPDVVNDGMEPELADGFRRFASIGVRDRNTFQLVERYGGRRPELVLDPTLIYDFFREVEEHKILDYDYLLVYAYGDRLDSKEEVAAIKHFATQNGLRIVSTAFYHAWCDENIVVKPFELLALFRGASFVVTDTFHGCIFSIKNRRQFVAFLRPSSRLASNVNKVDFLLHQLGLETRIVRDLGSLASQLSHPVAYGQVENTLDPLRVASLEFLARALHGDTSVRRIDNVA